MQSFGCLESVSYAQSKHGQRPSRSTFGRRTCSTKHAWAGRKRISGQVLKECFCAPADAADAASRLSAVAEHTNHDLVASTSDAVLNSPDIGVSAAQNLDSTLSEASQLCFTLAASATAELEPALSEAGQQSPGLTESAAQGLEAAVSEARQLSVDLAASATQELKLALPEAQQQPLGLESSTVQGLKSAPSGTSQQAASWTYGLGSTPNGDSQQPSEVPGSRANGLDSASPETSQQPSESPESGTHGLDSGSPETSHQSSELPESGTNGLNSPSPEASPQSSEFPGSGTQGLQPAPPGASQWLPDSPGSGTYGLEPAPPEASPRLPDSLGSGTYGLDSAPPEASPRLSDSAGSGTYGLDSAPHEASQQSSELAGKAQHGLNSFFSEASQRYSDLAASAAQRLESAAQELKSAISAANQQSSGLATSATQSLRSAAHRLESALSEANHQFLGLAASTARRLEPIRSETASAAQRLELARSEANQRIEGLAASAAHRLESIRSETASAAQRLETARSEADQRTVDLAASAANRFTSARSEAAAAAQRLETALSEATQRSLDLAASAAHSFESGVSNVASAPQRLQSSVSSAVSEATQRVTSNLHFPSLPGESLLPSSSAEAPLAPHYGTQAAVESFQQALAAVSDGLQLPVWQTTTLPNFTSAKQTAEAAYAGALDQLSEALTAAVAPLNQLTASLTSQLAAGDEQAATEPHFGSHAAAAAAAQLSQWLATQLNSLSGSSQGSYSPTLKSAVEDLQQRLSDLQSQGRLGPELLQQATHSLQALKASIDTQLSNVLPGVSSPAVDLSQFTTTLTNFQHQQIGGYDASTIAILGAAVLFAVTAASLPEASWGLPDPLDTLPWEWNASSVGSYWSRRPVAVARRSVAVTFAGLTVGLGLALDRAAGKVAINSPKRAAQLRKVIENLGPAYVKVAQAVSTRGDVLDLNYLREIERLQDRVPPFPTKAALPIMAEAFGRPVDEVFSSLSVEPVASASLGQVYKGRLREMYGGGEVAVKVQRPHVQASVALDLLLMRRFAAFTQTFPQVRTNWVGLIDEWATRFFHELDYEREAQNGMTFKEQMAGLEGIVVADVYQDLSSKEVLTTVWVEGEKLSESTAGDVRELCTTLLNCYLIQLLETGFLHADPHPGNLIRTPEGQICILDFGLMTEVTPEQSLALVEYIAHLSVEDWDGIARDLRNLGFVPADAPEMAELGLIEPLGNILSQLSQGGGAKGINIDAVTIALDELSRDYPIDIPPYFALILRAFSVIEGTALRVDPNYAIVKETFPYLSRRLLTDNQPRARAALRQLLYGNKARLDITRLQRLSSGLGSFTTDGIRSTQPGAATPALDSTSREILRMIFDRDGSYLQELLVDELVAGADAVGREAVSEVTRAILGTPPALATFGTLQALGPLRLLLVPFLTPFEVLYRLQPAVAPNAEDQEALLTVRGIWSLLQPNLNQGDSKQAQQFWEEIYPLLPELLPGLSLTAELFARQLLARVALRVAEELQRPPTRHDQPGSMTGPDRPQYGGYDTQI